MTGDEMERAIEFLLQSQAQADTRKTAFAERQDHTDRQIAEMSKQMQGYAATQCQCINRLAALVERNISGGNGNA
jgi:hypothetical protein